MNTNKDRYWIVVANASKLKIFSSNSPLYQSNRNFSFIQELEHNESRLQSHELGNDRPGRYKTHESGGSAYQPANDAQDIEKDQFAKKIASQLKQAKNSNRYDQILLVIPKQFYGILKTHLDQHVSDSIYKLIYKDFINRSTEDLSSMIFGEINGVQ